MTTYLALEYCVVLELQWKDAERVVTLCVTTRHLIPVKHRFFAQEKVGGGIERFLCIVFPEMTVAHNSSSKGLTILPSVPIKYIRHDKYVLSYGMEHFP
jgi:hypothetical protein